ncbi:hypothetical protein ICNINCKA_01795 [Synechococcus sp. CBW1107]|nr:hypothetical protein ICNINCKA_01795 [Synechococcus sp. CBW1107]
MSLPPELSLPSDGRLLELLGSLGGLSAELFDQQSDDGSACNAPGDFKCDMPETPGYSGAFQCNGCSLEESMVKVYACLGIDQPNWRNRRPERPGLPLLPCGDGAPGKGDHLGLHHNLAGGGV